MTARTTTAAALLLACGLVLTGCSSTPEPTADPTPTGSPRPTVTTTAPPSEPAPAPAPDPEPVTCDTVLSAEATAALAEQGLELRDGTTPGYPLAEQFAAAGATACTWVRPQSDVHLTVVQLEVAEGEQEAWARVLADNGYVLTDDPVPGAHAGPVDGGTGISPVAVVESGRITFVSTPTIIADLTPAP